MPKHKSPPLYVYRGLINLVADQIEARRKAHPKENPEDSFKLGFGGLYLQHPIKRMVYKSKVQHELAERKFRRGEKPDLGLVIFPDPRSKLWVVELPGFPPKPKTKRGLNYSLDLNPPPGAA